MQPGHSELNIVLASSSPRRKDLLQEIGLSFRVEASGVSEEVTGQVTPGRFVEILAERKARDVSSRMEGEDVLVIGSDTVVVLDGKILGKPVDEGHAYELLSCLQGQTHEVYTGLSVIGCAENVVRTTHSSTRVTMNPMSPEKIRRYIATGEPMDKAGAYAIQGLGATLVSGIEGDYFTVVGLPLALLSAVLGEFGVQVL
jgi:septum formation protein